MPISAAMGLALHQATLAQGRTSPRPPVGAVLILDGNVVGSGHTQPPGGAHAEVMALRQAGSAAYGATLFVTLEPCCHYGSTPPCTDAILAGGVTAVVVALEDPNPLVAGKGIKQLRETGIAVTTGDGALEVLPTLAPFFKHITSGLPWVTAKWAMTLDGHIATTSGDSRWISNEPARMWAHQLRDEVDAIVVGIGTALQDDPHLTVRLDPPYQLGREPRTSGPLRVVLDSTCQLPLSHHLCTGLATTPTRVYTTHMASEKDASRLRTCGVEVVTVATGSQGGVCVQEVLHHLGASGCIHILVEGGNRVLGSFFDAKAVDEVAAVVAPIVTGGSLAPSAVGGRGVQRIPGAWRLESTRLTGMGDNVLMRGTVRKASVQP